MSIEHKWLTTDLQFPTHLDLKGMAMAEARYSFVSTFVKNKIVLDLGCGIGSGSYLISHDAQILIGIDLSKDVLAHGRQKFREKNLHFICADATYLPLQSCNFEVVLSFEIIEHLKDSTKFLLECKRVLKNKNFFIISTPNKLVTSPYWKRPLNPVHVKEFTPRQIHNLLSKFFVVNYFRGQLVKPKYTLYKSYIYALAGQTLNALNLRVVKKIYRLIAFKSLKTVNKEEFAVKMFTLTVANMIVVCSKSEP